MTTYAQLKQEGRQEGRQEGEQIGIQKKEIEVVLALHEDQFPIGSIAKYAKLSMEEVTKILKNHGKIN